MIEKKNKNKKQTNNNNNNKTGRQAQKSDRINSDRQSGSDQLGSTRIVSDHEKTIKLNEIETITQLKVKIPEKKWAKLRKTRDVSPCRAV